jgi:hypothetical protein
MKYLIFYFKKVGFKNQRNKLKLSENIETFDQFFLKYNMKKLQHSPKVPLQFLHGRFFVADF